MDSRTQNESLISNEADKPAVKNFGIYR